APMAADSGAAPPHPAAISLGLGHVLGGPLGALRAVLRLALRRRPRRHAQRRAAPGRRDGALSPHPSPPPHALEGARGLRDEPSEPAPAEAWGEAPNNQ